MGLDVGDLDVPDFVVGEGLDGGEWEEREEEEGD